MLDGPGRPGSLRTMQALTADEIRASMVNTTKGEAKRLHVPRDLDATRWDDLDFLGWRDPGAPAFGALVTWRGDEPLGIALSTVPSGPRRRKQSMCSLCLTFHGSGDVALMAARRAGTSGREGNTVGASICADLACSLYVRGLKRTPRVQPHETLTVDEKVRRLNINLWEFIARVSP